MNDRPTDKSTDKPTDKKEAAASDPKRPHATLDLKATEVKSAENSKTGATSSAETSATAKAGSAKKPADTASAAPAANSSGIGRIVSHLLAGLAGGAVVLFGGEELSQLTGVPTPSQRVDQATAALEQRLVAVEKASKSETAGVLAATEERLGRVDSLAVDVTALRENQEKLSEATTSLSEAIKAGPDLSQTDERIAKLEEQLKLIASAASGDGNASPIGELTALTAKISELETSLSAEIAKVQETAPADLNQRLATLSEASESVTTDLARITQRIETLNADSERIQKALQAAQEETGRVSSALREVRATLDKQANTFARTADVEAAVTPVTGLISKIEGNLAGVLKNEKERRAQTERIVVALELGNLKRAVERGQPFAAELEAVKTASGGSLDLKALAPFKESGVPTLADLQEQGRPVLLAAIDAAAISPDASVWDRMMAGAKSVVRIRKVDAEPDEVSTEAIVARIEKSLEEGRLGDVLAEADKLPPQASEKLADWRTKVAARHSVEQAIAATESELKAALAPPDAPATANPAQ
jgi:hypothetical protein